MIITDMKLDDLKKVDVPVYAMILSDINDEFAAEYIRRKYPVTLEQAMDAYTRLKGEYNAQRDAEKAIP